MAIRVKQNQQGTSSPRSISPPPSGTTRQFEESLKNWKRENNVEGGGTGGGGAGNLTLSGQRRANTLSNSRQLPGGSPNQQMGSAMPNTREAQNQLGMMSRRQEFVIDGLGERLPLSTLPSTSAPSQNNSMGLESMRASPLQTSVSEDEDEDNNEPSPLRQTMNSLINRGQAWL